MTAVRRHLTAIGIGYLLFQVSAFAMSPFAACCAVAARAAVDDDVCCKGMAPGQMCPLHKHRQAPKDTAHHDEAPSRSAVRSSCAPVDPALISFAFGLGILPEAVSVDVLTVSIPVPASHATVTHRSRSLDPPPPRA
jgi:hypothetical protein